MFKLKFWAPNKLLKTVSSLKKTLILMVLTVLCLVCKQFQVKHPCMLFIYLYLYHCLHLFLFLYMHRWLAKSPASIHIHLCLWSDITVGKTAVNSGVNWMIMWKYMSQSPCTLLHGESMNVPSGLYPDSYL